MSNMVTYQDKYLEANNKKGTNFFLSIKAISKHNLIRSFQ